MMEEKPVIKTKTEVLRLILTFFAVAAVLMGLMILVALIPRSLIKDNMQASAEYLEDKKLFGTRIKNVNGSKMDYYADSILLGIIWQLDAKKPLESVMETGYYSDKYGYENLALLSAVKEDLPVNKEYLRYWHGSAVYLKPLFIFLNLRQIYMVNAFVLLLLLFLVVFKLYRLKAYAPILAIVLGLVTVSAWFVPLTLEYTWCFMLMLLFSILTVNALSKGKENRLIYYFLVFGMLTAFFDFLTTELIVLFIPLLIVIWYEVNKNHKEINIVQYIRYCILWFCGYVSMWALKWLLAGIVLGRNVWHDVSSQIEYRINGKVKGTALLRNLKCLFPFEYGTAGVIAGLLLIVAVLCFAFIFHKKACNKKLCVIYLIIAVIPYLRYLILRNHSYIHCFFTYRAQLITVFALILFMDEITAMKKKNNL
ncbi:MAG: hypothetical protein IJM14_07640 [Lachnospiraceae bacterium]|nr:hypothetical protein [Lachnospiraceae bacterium]